MEVISNMKINEKKFNRNLIRHKKLISMVGKFLQEKEKGDYEDDELAKILIPAKMLGIELTLVRSGFKCEKTGVEKDLQIHHLISKENIKLTNYGKYLTQRNYWANMVVLTKNEHKHNWKNGGILSQDKIDGLKKKYELNDK